ncbi:uncharacterized protein LOC128855809 [Anastrepha ludens]|uniref:uncharacterized protein LOC128855809 n=1 Tax=Anastrepha ludens TaxID=28586 RepID=UPI0023B07137|nr:uncharacterized protein LOC128855809 [Anastrepha ludens]
MAQKLKNIMQDKQSESKNETDASKKRSVQYKGLKIFLQKDLPSCLITENSINLFERFNINPAFLNENAAEWHLNPKYIEGKKILDNINVVNDTAERGVKLMEEFNNSFTKNENQKQFVLQVVEKYRKTYPKHTREAMSVDFSNKNNK